MSNYLPIGLVEQVLLRLPMKPLLQCTSICKTWYNLITSSDFINAHLDFTKSLPNSTHIVGMIRTKFYVLYPDDKPGRFEEFTKFAFKDEDVQRKSTLSISGSCNGLICLTMCRSYKQKVVLWNPAIRRSLYLPRSSKQVSFNPVHPHVFGFVFDHIGNDYKVLTMVRNSDVRPHVEVFRLSTGLWKDISCEALEWLPPFPFPSSFQVDLKGIAHWLGKEKYDYGLKIVSFDVHKEVFGSIELPFDVVNHDWKYWNKYLFVFEESMFLIRQVPAEDAYDENEWKFDVWRMGEYNVVESWKQLQTWVFNESVKPLGFRKNGDILWIVREGKLVSTNLKNASVNYLSICQKNIYDSSCIYYAESLILLDQSLSSACEDKKVKMLQRFSYFD